MLWGWSTGRRLDGPGATPAVDVRRLSGPTKRLVKLLVFALVVHLFVLPQIGGAREALSVLGSTNPVLLVLALALEIGAFLAYAQLTRLLISRENRPPITISFAAVMASTGVNHVVPGGAATTAAVNYRLLGRAGVPTDELGFALGTEAIGSAVVLNAILWVSLVLSIPISGFHPLYATAAAVGAVLIALVSIAVVLLLRGSEALAARVSSVLGRVPRVDEASVHDALLRVADQLRALASDRRRLRTVIAFAAANWLLDAAALYVAVSAFGPRPSVIGVLVAYGLANVLAAIPISPGGLGIIEAVLIPSLVGFGTPRAQASIAVVVYRLVNFWMPIPVGGIAYLVVGRLDPHGPGDIVEEIDRESARLASHGVGGTGDVDAPLRPRPEPRLDAHGDGADHLDGPPTDDRR